MLTSDHTRYRVKYLKRFKGAQPKIVVQRTITYLENTNHPLTEIHFKNTGRYRYNPGVQGT